MGEECSGGNCETDCGSSCGNSCEGGSCGAGCECSSECGCPSPDELAMIVGKMAMFESLKERVKKKMEANMGKKLDKIADLIVEGFGNHMQEHQSIGKKQEWMSRLMAAMME